MAFNRQLAEKLACRGGDRDVARFFAGRREEIKHFDFAVQDAKDRDKAQAVFRIFQGPPGCGKTSLAAHLANTRGRVPDGPSHEPQQSDPDLLFVPCDPPDLKDGDALLAKIGACARAQKGVAQRLAGAAIGGVAAKVGANTLAEEVFDLMARAELDQRTIVLHLDEAHARANPEKHPDVADTLVNLHTTGLGLPCVVLLTGLGHTYDTIAKIPGLSRLGYDVPHEMGPLSHAECRRSTLMLLNDVELSKPPHSQDARRLADLAATLSDGWPAHLTGAQAALCAEAVRVDGALRRVDEGRVRQASESQRHDYYMKRIQAIPTFDTHPALTQQIIVDAAKARLTDRDGLETVCEAIMDGAGASERLKARGATAAVVSDALVKKGIFRQAVPDASGKTGWAMEPSIPSMARWAARQIGVEPPPRRDAKSSFQPATPAASSSITGPARKSIPNALRD